MKIALAETEADIARCYPVMVELRPHRHIDMVALKNVLIDALSNPA